ncbi:MAG TPA: hypothetical protein VJ790_18200 [Dongiaceae bacterium]|nr:hypothetical protein [Dongiaceae bacterium]
MKENPFEIEQRLTSELFDHYVAKARAERAEAIAEFGRWVARQLRALVARIAARPVGPAAAPAARKLAG